MEKCLTVLERGGLLLYPTDTVWGIGCDATNTSAVEKIFQLKKRPDTKAMIILVADEKTIANYAEAGDEKLFEYLRQAARPTTVIYEKAKNLAGNLVAQDGTIAIRICRDPFCRQLIKKFGKPIVSTSANLSGTTAPTDFSAISDEIKNGVDYIVHYRQDDTRPAQPSSVIRWQNGQIEVLRP